MNRFLALLLAAPAIIRPSPGAAQEAPFTWSGSEPGELRRKVELGRAVVEAFFGAPYRERVTIVVLPDRAALNRFVEREWKMPGTECWMVAAGVARTLVILAPARWKAEACEHDGSDSTEVQEIVTHELVHVYHGQHNPEPDFDGLDDIGWFVEGVATYAAGQLEHRHRDAARNAIAARADPAHLKDAWSGKYRYGVSGSLVAFVDATLGRPGLSRLLGATTNAALLEPLGLDEAGFLARWKAFVAAGSVSR